MPESRLRRLLLNCDLQVAAVVSILLGLFQLLLAVPLYHMDISLPRNLFLLPLAIGSLIVASGSFTMACVKSPTRYMQRGCAYSNVAVLLGALLALCLYGYSLRSIEEHEDCDMSKSNYYYFTDSDKCAGVHLAHMLWCLTILLIVYDVCAVVLHSALSVSAIRTLRQAN